MSTHMAEQVSSPPSSPPMGSGEDQDETPKPSTKRSLEDINDVDDVPTSSHTFIGDTDSTQPQAQPSAGAATSSAFFTSSTQAHRSMLPPARPQQSSGAPPLEKAPPSGQGSVNVPTDQPEAAQQVKPTPQETEKQKPLATSSEVSPGENADSPDSSQALDPEENMQYFDWNDLQQRYHDRIRELEATEVGIYSEFSSLCQYFEIWAQAGSAYEVDRSFKRLKTRMTLVQHRESELEQKRQHYVQVVNAFKSALQLLAK